MATTTFPPQATSKSGPEPSSVPASASPDLPAATKDSTVTAPSSAPVMGVLVTDPSPPGPPSPNGALIEPVRTALSGPAVELD